MSNLYVQLKSSDLLQESIFKIKFLDGLSQDPKFEKFVVSIRSQEVIPDTAALIAKTRQVFALDEEVAHTEDKTTALQASTSNKPKLRCFYCKRRGHQMRDGYVLARKQAHGAQTPEGPSRQHQPPVQIHQRTPTNSNSKRM